jgi:hypothetical protein
MCVYRNSFVPYFRILTKGKAVAAPPNHPISHHHNSLPPHTHPHTTATTPHPTPGDRWWHRFPAWQVIITRQVLLYRSSKHIQSVSVSLCVTHKQKSLLTLLERHPSGVPLISGQRLTKCRNNRLAALACAAHIGFIAAQSELACRKTVQETLGTLTVNFINYLQSETKLFIACRCYSQHYL